jgi:hypothetical protein
MVNAAARPSPAPSASRRTGQRRDHQRPRQPAEHRYEIFEGDRLTTTNIAFTHTQVDPPVPVRDRERFGLPGGSERDAPDVRPARAE